MQWLLPEVLVTAQYWINYQHPREGVYNYKQEIVVATNTWVGPSLSLLAQRVYLKPNTMFPELNYTVNKWQWCVCVCVYVCVCVCVRMCVWCVRVCVCVSLPWRGSVVVWLTRIWMTPCDGVQAASRAMQNPVRGVARKWRRGFLDCTHEREWPYPI